jgi:hypothetical protein
MPERVHVEMARDLGKSRDRRPHRIPGHKITRIDELLPLRYAAAAA